VERGEAVRRPGVDGRGVVGEEVGQTLRATARGRLEDVQLEVSRKQRLGDVPVAVVVGEQDRGHAAAVTLARSRRVLSDELLDVLPVAGLDCLDHVRYLPI